MGGSKMVGKEKSLAWASTLWRQRWYERVVLDGRMRPKWCCKSWLYRKEGAEDVHEKGQESSGFACPAGVWWGLRRLSIVDTAINCANHWSRLRAPLPRALGEEDRTWALSWHDGQKSTANSPRGSTLATTFSACYCELVGRQREHIPAVCDCSEARWALECCRFTVSFAARLTAAASDLSREL